MQEADEKIRTLFLTGKHLKRVMAHMCNNASSHVADPITDTVVMMLTCPINLVVTEVGIALFKASFLIYLLHCTYIDIKKYTFTYFEFMQDKPTALFPYSEMDSDQRYFVEQVVQSCLLHCNRVSEVPSLSSPDSYKHTKLPYYHMYHHAVVQMGGGCILYTKNTLSSADAGSRGRGRSVTSPPSLCRTLPPFLKATEVLRAMCDCIFSSKDYGDTDVLQTICSIVLQRVSCMTQLKQEDQRSTNEYIFQLKNAGGT